MKKIIIILFSLFLFTIVSNAQFSYQKLVSQNNYDKAFKKAKSELKKNNKSLLANYNLVMLHYLYSKKIFRSYNYDKLKNNIDEANSYLSITVELSNTDKSIVFEDNQLKELENNICKLAFEITKLNGENDAYENYIKKYSSCTLNIEKAKEALLKNDYFVAEIINTIDSYKSFINKYPDSEYSFKALQHIDSLTIVEQIQDSINELNKLAINQVILKEKKDTAIINRYMKYASFIKPVWLNRVDFDGLNGNIIKRNKSSNDSLEQLYGYLISIPIDIKYSEVPYLVKILDSILYNGELPIDAEYFSINNDLHEIMKLINQFDKGSYLDPLRKQLLLLKDKYWSNLPKGENSNWVEESFTIKKYQCKTKDIDDIYNYLEKMIIERLKIGFYDALIAHGIKVSCNTPILTNGLQTTELEIELNTARKNKNTSKIASLEKELVNLLIVVLNNNYDKNIDTDIEISEQSPSYFLLNGNQPNCVGFTMISSRFLDKWGIESNILLRSGHIFSCVTLSDQSNYIMDVMYNTKLIKPIAIGKLGNYTKIKIDEDTVSIIKKATRQGIAGAYFLNIYNQERNRDKRNLSKELLLCNECTLLIPYLEAPWYNIASINKDLKKYQEAKEAIDICIFNNPDDYISWLLKKSILLELDDFDGYKKARLKLKELE